MSNSLTITLIDKWNKQKVEEYGSKKGELYFSERDAVERKLSDLREKEITNYRHCYSYDRQEDNEFLEAFQSLFDWEERFSIRTDFQIVAREDFSSYTKCADLEEAKNYLNLDLEIEEPDAEDIEYETTYRESFDFGEETLRELQVEIVNLRIKENVSKIVSSEYFARNIKSRIVEPISGHTDLSKEEKISLIQNVLDELAKEDNK